MSDWKDIPFWKMHGSGNDFILIDNREGLIKADDAPGAAKQMCRRGFGIGADGLILIESSDKADFRWRFLNADGSHADMCGNGGRCAARFAHEKGIAPREMTFETGAGIISAEVDGDVVKLQLSDPKDLAMDLDLSTRDDTFRVHHVNTGVPHAVLFFDKVDSAPVFEIGRLIRHHRHFAPDGANVNFVEVAGPSFIRVRTYERGVEDETQACGTGAVASAIISSLKGLVDSPVEVETSGGERLTIHFKKEGDKILEVFLQGKAVVVYEGMTREL